MAKIIDEGSLPPDDPINKSGPLVGGKRLGRKKPVLSVIDSSMNEEQVMRSLISSLRKSGFKISSATEAELMAGVDEDPE